MIKAWLIGVLVTGILSIPIFQNWGQPEDLRPYINRFLYLGLGSFVLFLVLKLIAL